VFEVSYLLILFVDYVLGRSDLQCWIGGGIFCWEEEVLTFRLCICGMRLEEVFHARLLHLRP